MDNAQHNMDFEPHVTPVKLEVLEPWNAFNRVVWHGLDTPITHDEVDAAVHQGRLRTTPLPLFDFIHDPPTRQDHIERVAYLVVNTANEPISIDVGAPEIGYHASWIIEDGNHRLAAAFHRHDTHINAIVSGSIRHAADLLQLRDNPRFMLPPCAAA